MKLYPKISIVTPSFNQADYLEETILSVLGQNYPNLEYIIIDGGSKDDSVEIIKKYSHQLAYWISEKDAGQYDAINKGFEKSSGEIMTYINSDDLLSANSLFSIAQIFNDYENINWISGITHMIDENNRSVFVGNYTLWNKAKYLKKDFKFIQQEGVFWRKQLWENCGANISTRLKLASDMELWSRFFSQAELYIYPGILGSFRLRSSNQKTLESIDLYLIEAAKVLDEMPKSAIEINMIKKSNSMIYKLINRIDSKLLLKLLGYSAVDKWLKNAPPKLRFERKSMKFIIEN